MLPLFYRSKTSGPRFIGDFHLVFTFVICNGSSSYSWGKLSCCDKEDPPPQIQYHKEQREFLLFFVIIQGK